MFNLNPSDSVSNEQAMHNDKSYAKKRLLIHSCCGPCSAWVLTSLSDKYQITIYYYNPNIFPTNEYDKRLLTQETIIEKLPFRVDLIKGEYNHQLYSDAISGLETLGEKSQRCYQCFKQRISATAKLAVSLGFEIITTTLSVSPHKNSTWLNEIGNQVAKEHKLTWLTSDFKKANGYQKSIALAKEYGLYRQDYCGCEYSLEESIKRRERRRTNE